MRRDAMDGAVHATPAQEAVVCSVDDGINLLGGDVASYDFDLVLHPADIFQHIKLRHHKYMLPIPELNSDRIMW